jgi:hypothetical protein
MLSGKHVRELQNYQITKLPDPFCAVKIVDIKAGWEK